jgi:hypothetical protein
MGTLTSHIDDPTVGVEEIAHSAANSAIQAVAKELSKAGIRGGLGDDRALRALIYAVAARNVAAMRINARGATP